MTEKRFTINEFSTLDAMASIDVICDNGIELPSSTACDLLNKLNDENEQLKQFQTNVFTLINEMIETANLYRTPIKTLDYGDDLGYWNGVYQKLKELRDILENEQTRK